MGRQSLRQGDDSGWIAQLRTVAEVNLDGSDLAEARAAIRSGNEQIARAALRGFIQKRRDDGRLATAVADKALLVVSA